MKASELKNKTAEELRQMLNELRAESMKLSFDRNEKKLKDSSKIGKVKRNIARILTVLNSNK